METNCFQKILDVIFILHVMSDKAVFVSGALFCVQRYQGNLISPAPTAPPAGREFICIYMRPQIV